MEENHIKTNLKPNVDLIIIDLHFPSPEARRTYIGALIDQIAAETGLKKRRIVGNLNRLPHTHFVLAKTVDAAWAENLAKRLVFFGAAMYIRYQTHDRYEEHRE